MHSDALIEAHSASFKRDGCTMLPKIFNKATLQRWRDLHRRLQREAVEGATIWMFDNMCERAPNAMLPACTHPLVLDLLAEIMGPCVQLDTLLLEGAPPAPDDSAPLDPGYGWHRDRWDEGAWNEVMRPLGVHAICALQDRDDHGGLLQVILGSHRHPVTIPPEGRCRPHPDERVVWARAGDLVLLHPGLLHTGWRSTASSTRYWVRAYYNLSWMMPTDDYAGPNVQYILEMAEEARDERLLRLFGRDEPLEERRAGGCVDTDEARGKVWRLRSRHLRHV